MKGGCAATGPPPESEGRADQVFGDPAYITSVPVILVTGVPALPVVVPVAVGTHVPLVVRVTVAVEVVVAAAPVPVGTPARIPPLTGAPVVSRRRSDGLGLGDCRRS